MKMSSMSQEVVDMQCEVERRGRIFFPDFCNLCLRFAPTDRWLLGFDFIFFLCFPWRILPYSMFKILGSRS